MADVAGTRDRNRSNKPYTEEREGKGRPGQAVGFVRGLGVGARMQTACSSVWRLAKPPGKANSLFSSSPAPTTRHQLPAGLAVAYARSSRRRVGVWQKACAALPTGSRALREFAVPSRDPRQRNSRPPGLARVCATGSGQVGTWQLENILQDRPVVNLHRAIQASFLFDRAAELRVGANVFRPTQKNSGCLF